MISTSNALAGDFVPRLLYVEKEQDNIEKEEQIQVYFILVFNSLTN